MDSANLVRGMYIPNSSGLVTTTAVVTGDLVHTLSVGASARIRKIMFSNNTGANITLIFGTQQFAAAVFIASLPTIMCITGFDGELTEDQIPDVIWRIDRTAAAGSNGNIYVVSSAAGVLVRLTVEEKRA